MKDLLISIISNDNGVGSSNRLCLLIIIVAIVMWSSYMVYTTGSIPDISESWVYLVGIFVGGTAAGKATDKAKIFKKEEDKEV